MKPEHEHLDEDQDDGPNDAEASPGAERELSPWFRIPAGLLLFVFTLLCSTGIVGLFWAADENLNLPALFAVGGICALLVIWVVAKSIRLMFGWRTSGGLLSPFGLRVCAWVFLLMPIAGIFTGYYTKHGFAAILQAIAYAGVCFGLNTLAKTRTRKHQQAIKATVETPKEDDP